MARGLLTPSEQGGAHETTHPHPVHQSPNISELHPTRPHAKSVGHGQTGMAQHESGNARGVCQGKGEHMTLPADVARCIGTDLPECKTCRRRTEPPHERQVWTGPWELEGVPCEQRIPSDQNRTQSVKDRGHAGAAGSRPAHSGRTF
jgi:hypothetical protein